MTLPWFHFEFPGAILILGLITGLSYALLGVGLTLVYRSSRVINFAHGQMGSLAAKVMLFLVLNHGLNYWLALGVALPVAALSGLFIELVVIRKLARAPRLIVLIATIGVAQLFFILELLIPEQQTVRGTSQFPTPFTARVHVGNLVLGAGHLMILVVVPVVVVALTLFLRRTKMGVASRAAAENEDAAKLAGVPVQMISLVIWILVGLLAGASAILVGPTKPVLPAEAAQVALGPTLMLRALGAAMLGGLVNLPLVFAGGVAIGVIELLVSWNYPTGGALELVLFAVLLVSLLVRRGLGQVTRGGEESSWSLAGTVRQLPESLARLPQVRAARRVFMTTLLLAVAVLPVVLRGSQLVLVSSICLFAVMALSLVVLTGLAGQVSLGQFAFVGLGALVGGRMHQLGYGPPGALVYAVLAGGVVALVIGIPALRIRGLFLAVTTLGFAVASTGWLFQQHWLVQTSAETGTSLEIPRPRWLGINFQSERNYFWACLVVLVLVALAVHRLRDSGVGRAMMAVRDNEAQAAALGISPRKVKLIAFVVAGMIAALAGYFYGGLIVNFSDPHTTFRPDLSLALAAIVILGGVTTVTGAIFGALWLRGLQYFIGPLIPDLIGSNVAFLLSGVGLLAAVLQFPGGIASLAFRVRDAVLTRLVGERLVGQVEPDEQRERPRLPPSAAAPRATRDAPAIEAEDVTVHFGGNEVLAGVSLRAGRGEIVGLIGPNGAGKTTLFDVLAGRVSPTHGLTRLHGQDISGLRTEQRAKLGLGRTFQQARLFAEMPLTDVFKVALERHEVSELVPSVLGLRPARRAERRKQLRAEEIIDLLGLRPFARQNIAELSTGTRRFAELGCLVALGADVLLLDEPTAGIAQREVEAFTPVISEIRDHLDATIVIIEHDIPLMMQLVDRLYVVAAGVVIAEGPPEQLREDPRVVAAYLGSDERLIRRSGKLAPPRAGR